MTKDIGPVDPAQMTALLRAGVLAIHPSSLGLQPVDSTSVWGVMLEFGHEEVVTSLVTLMDGSVSIYLSDGSGAIGCGLHPDVRIAAKKMLAIAQHAPPHCIKMAQFPQPGPGYVTVYLLTHQGVLGATLSRLEMDEGAVELAELYYAGHGVVDLVELLGAGVDLVDEMRLTDTQLKSGAAKDKVEAQIAQRELITRGRACRILPYVGTVARRSQS